MKNLIIYGGTFDPPHLGHLNTALTIQDILHFNRLIFLPCKTPVLKQATLASSEQRVNMLKLALEGYSNFEIDLREITRDTPSFMVDTLEAFRRELGGQTAITLCIGSDAFIQLPQWHCWEKILKLSNLLVIKRAPDPVKAQSYDTEPDQADSCDQAAGRQNRETFDQSMKCLQNLLLTHETFDKNTLKIQPYGAIYRFDAGQYPISSSWLREELQAGHNVDAYLPPRVIQYIKSQALYPFYPSP